jgi:hypothetical protein|tara:strand:+ start:596 stop:1162 length:567 start_codon:yes stop_codon:yes gene_type:complete
MTFWTDPKLEPKRGYKFILSMPGGNSTTGLREFLVKSVGKPQFEIGTTPHAFLNHTFYYPGKTTWQPITAVVVDTVDASANATQEIMHMLEESGYELPTNPAGGTGLGTVSKDKAVNAALGQVKIKTLDSSGNIVEEWVLNNAFLQRAEFGDLSYDNEDLLNVTLTIQYDNAFVNVIQGDGPIPSTSA